MNYHELINEISRLRPFELGDDQYAHGQNDTIERILDIIRYMDETMNQDDRIGMRAKHGKVDYRDGADVAKCGYCNNGEWPCDTILVLNAWEASL